MTKPTNPLTAAIERFVEASRKSDEQIEMRIEGRLNERIDARIVEILASASERGRYSA